MPAHADAWCEMDSCISHYEHPAALEKLISAPVRSRLVGESMRWAYWLPPIKEAGPLVLTTHPVAVDRHRAVRTSP
jgi:hypothetical protein